MSKYNERGILHLIVPILIMALFAAVGALMMLNSHAAGDPNAGTTKNAPAATPSTPAR